MIPHVELATLEEQLKLSTLAYYRRLRPVAEYVARHLHEPLPLGRLAGVAGLEPKYFSALFRKRVGIRLTEWLRVYRVARAARLLHASDEHVSRVAFAVGFGDLRTFQRAFKRYFGASPRAYRTALYADSRQVTHSSGILPRTTMSL